MKRPAIPCLILALALLLAACQEPAPSYTYAGISLTDGVERDLTLTFERRGDRLTGEYVVDAARGSFIGTAADTTVTAELTPSPACTYRFEGALTETTLTGEFAPTACPGGTGGIWTLELR